MELKINLDIGINGYDQKGIMYTLFHMVDNKSIQSEDVILTKGANVIKSLKWCGVVLNQDQTSAVLNIKSPIEYLNNLYSIYLKSGEFSIVVDISFDSRIYKEYEDDIKSLFNNDIYYITKEEVEVIESVKVYKLSGAFYEKDVDNYFQMIYILNKLLNIIDKVDEIKEENE